MKPPKISARICWNVPRLLDIGAGTLFEPEIKMDVVDPIRTSIRSCPNSFQKRMVYYVYNVIKLFKSSNHPLVGGWYDHSLDLPGRSHGQLEIKRLHHDIAGMKVSVDKLILEDHAHVSREAWVELSWGPFSEDWRRIHIISWFVKSSWWADS